jgi:outer membrane immunogenic protein
MKHTNFGVLTISALLIAAPLSAASAADMPLKAPPLVAAPWDWTGFYLGGNIGYSWGRDSNTTTGALIFPSPLGLGTTDSPNVKGVIGGFQGGYNWQLAPQWLLGLEADFDLSGERARDGGSDTTALFIPFDPTGIGIGGNPGCRLGAGAPAGCTLTTTLSESNEWKLRWVSTFRARLGMIPDPTLLLYVTGGLAIGEAQFGTTTSPATMTLTSNFTGAVLSTTTTGAGASFSQSTTRAGFAVGGGAEKKLTQNWSVRGEYLYVDLGSHTFLSGTGLDTNIRVRDNIVRAGFDYQFSPK